VVPSSPVRVAITDKRLAMHGSEGLHERAVS
jgi:hypothetical protein